MRRRLPAVLLPLVLGLVGLVLGLADFRQTLRFPLERYERLGEVARPTSLAWMAPMRGHTRTLDLLERPLTAVLALLLLLAFALLAATLNPKFRPLKPPGENPGKGFGAHVDVPLLFRSAGAALLSLWLLGGLQPLAALFFRDPRALAAGTIALGGLPVWASVIPGAKATVAHSVLLLAALWAIWGPGGLIARAEPDSPLRSVAWGALAGLAAFPGVAALYAGRVWVAQASEAFPLSDRAGWQLLLLLTFAVPALGGVLLGICASLFRPRAHLAGLRGLVPVAVVLAVLGGVGILQTRGALARLDVGQARLGARLGLPPYSLARIAVVVAPNGRSVYSVTSDGTDDVQGGDPIVSREETIKTVERYLERTNYRTTLAFRGFMHLSDCASIDWLSERNLRVDMAMLEHAPSPAALELLRQKLMNSPITAETRRILDTLADPKRFEWAEPEGSRWLGMAYRRFGDNARAREYLLHAGLSQVELRQALGGVAPLTEGDVTGQLSILGKSEAHIRLGLVRADRWLTMAGRCLPRQWRRVIHSVHTDAAGRFHFTHVPEGMYLLMITGGEIGRRRGNAVVTPAPDLIRLDRFHPTRELGRLDVTFVRSERRPDSPESTPGGTTASVPVARVNG